MTIPYTPMLGCIGTAPRLGRAHDAARPARTAATWTSSKSAPATRSICPSSSPARYLYLGDAHAAMGHGEFSASGLEMPAEAPITVDLVKGKTAPRPAHRITTPKS